MISPISWIQLEVNGAPVRVVSGSTVIQACERAGVEIPRFCYHERLLVAGNCRMCLVEIAGSPKPQASCALPVAPAMKVFTDTPRVKKARERVLEFLLLNHPLDCPICDQGGECDRQDESMAFGSDRSRGRGSRGSGVEAKRGVEDKSWGPRVKAIMTRCIHCTRCVRFSSEIAGVSDRGTSGRGVNTEIGTYINQPRTSELSGNVIDLCPVGALTAHSYGFKTRPWELKSVDTVDPTDSLGASIRVQSRGQQVLRILPQTNDEVNQAWLADHSRFAVEGIHRDRLTVAMTSGKPVSAGSTSEERLDAVLASLKKVGYSRQVVFSSHFPSTVALGMREWLSQRGWLTSSHLIRSTVVSGSGRALRSDVDPSSHPETRREVRGGSNSRGFDEGSRVDSRDGRSRLSAISEADAVRRVGVNPRSEFPLIHARLRESYLRDQVTVATRGSSVNRSFPVSHRGQAGSTREVLRGLISGTHSFSPVRAAAQRPRILVGSLTPLGSDSAEVDLLQSMRRRRGDRREGSLRSPSGTSGWKVLNTVHPHAGSFSSRLMGRPSFTGFVGEQDPARKWATLRVGVDEGDRALEGHRLPSSLAPSTVLALHTYLTPRTRAVPLALPRPTPYEREAQWMNTEGRVQRGVPAYGVAPSPSWTSDPWRTPHWTPTWRGQSITSRESSVGLDAHETGVEWAVRSTRAPRVVDYHLERHPVTRRSTRRAKASMSATRSSSRDSFRG